MSDTIFIVVRHGETEWNRARRMQGQSDSSLSALGREQAQRLGERMRGAGFDALYVSDLGRARDTARSIAEATRIEPVIEPRLRERHFGIFEGLTAEDMQARYPDEYARFKMRDPGYAMPGGESAQACHQRVIGCYEALAARHAGQTVVTVTHGQVLASVFRHAEGIALTVPRTFELYNASLNTFVRGAGGWRTVEMGDTRHLADGALTWA